MDASFSVEDGPKEVTGSSNNPEKRRSFRMEGPDGGMAWIVALAACAINFIMAGLARMSGILFVAFIAAYGVDRKTASMPFSVKSSTRNLLGPVVGILGQKYGVRKVSTIGGIIATLSASLCFFAPDITWITVLWGGIGGIGTALTVTLPQVVIGQYFDKYRTTAAGMAFSGGCVGSFLFPMLLDYLLQNYGVQGTLLVLGAVIAHTIPAALILVRPPWLERKVKSDIESVPKVVVTSPEESCEGNNEMEDLDETKGSRTLPNVEFLRQNSELVAKLIAVKTPLDDQVDHNEKVSISVLCILEEMEDVFRSLQISRGKSQFYQNLALPRNDQFGSLLQKDEKSICSKTKSFHPNSSFVLSPGAIHKSKSVPDLSKLAIETPRNSLLMKLKGLHCMKSPQIVALFPEENKLKVLKVSRELRKLFIISTKSTLSKLTLVTAFEKEKQSVLQNKIDMPQNNTHEDGFLDHIKTAIGLHTKPLFLLICLCRCVHFINFFPVTTAIVDYLKDKGFETEDGNYAIAALALGDLIGRLCFGWVTDRRFLGIGKYMMVVMILQGASTASLAMMHSRAILFTGLAVFGMLQGSLFVRHPVLVSMYMESHEQSIAMGCVNFFSGIIGFGLPAYIGYFRDTLHSYDYIFYINGALGALTGLLWALEPYFLRCCSKQRKSTDTTDEEESI